MGQIIVIVIFILCKCIKTIEEPNDRPVITPDDGNEPENRM